MEMLKPLLAAILDEASFDLEYKETGHKRQAPTSGNACVWTRPPPTLSSFRWMTVIAADAIGNLSSDTGTTPSIRMRSRNEARYLSSGASSLTRTT